MTEFKTIQATDAFKVETHPYVENLCFISTRYHNRMAYPLPTIQVRQDGNEFYDEDDDGFGPGIMEPLPVDASNRIVRRLEAAQELTAYDIPDEDVLKALGLTESEVRNYINHSDGISYTIYSPEDYAATFITGWEASGNDTPGIEEFHSRWGCGPIEFPKLIKTGKLPKNSDFEETGAVTKYGAPIWFVIERYN